MVYLWYELSKSTMSKFLKTKNIGALTIYVLAVIAITAMLPKQRQFKYELQKGKAWQYTYDLGGNILSKTRYAYTTGTVGAALQTMNYTYGDSNWKDKLTAYNGVTISYDAIGNPLTDGTWTYKYKGSWNQNSKGWWFGDTSGWYAKSETVKIGGKSYTFNSKGYLK